MKRLLYQSEVVDCIVLGSYPILEITIQSTVFPTVVHFPSGVLYSTSRSDYAVLPCGMCGGSVCPVPFGDYPGVLLRENT